MTTIIEQCIETIIRDAEISIPTIPVLAYILQYSCANIRRKKLRSNDNGVEGKRSFRVDDARLKEIEAYLLKYPFQYRCAEEAWDACFMISNETEKISARKRARKNVILDEDDENNEYSINNEVSDFGSMSYSGKMTALIKLFQSKCNYLNIDAILDDESNKSALSIILPILILSQHIEKIEDTLISLLHSSLSVDEYITIFRNVCDIGKLLKIIIKSLKQGKSTCTSSGRASYVWKCQQVCFGIAKMSKSNGVRVRSLLTESKLFPQLCIEISMICLLDTIDYLATIISSTTTISTHWLLTKFPDKYSKLVINEILGDIIHSVSRLNISETSSTLGEYISIRLKLLCIFSKSFPHDKICAFCGQFIDEMNKIDIPDTNDSINGSTCTTSKKDCLLICTRYIFCFILIYIANKSENSTTLNTTNVFISHLQKCFSLNAKVISHSSNGNGTILNDTNSNSCFEFAIIVSSVVSSHKVMRDICTSTLGISHIGDVIAKEGMARCTALIRDAFSVSSLPPEVIIRKFLELPVPPVISASTESAADWMTCLDILFDINSNRGLVPHRLHAIMLHVLAQSDFPPHSKIVRVVESWLKSCFYNMREAGLPLLPVEAQDMIQRAMMEPVEVNALYDDDEKERVVNLGDPHSKVDDLILLILKTTAEVSTQSCMENDSKLWRVSVVTYACVSWISITLGPLGVEDGGKLPLPTPTNSSAASKAVFEPTFATDISTLPITTMLSFLFYNKYQCPVIQKMLSTSLQLVKLISPDCLTYRSLLYLKSCSKQSCLSQLIFSDFIDNVKAGNITHINVALYIRRLKYASSEQLNIISDTILSTVYSHSLKDSNSRERSLDILWELWISLRSIHSYGRQIELRVLNRLLSENNICVMTYIFNYDTLAEEPILLLRFPLLFYKNTFHLKFILHVLHNILIVSEIRLRSATVMKNKIILFQNTMNMDAVCSEIKNLNESVYLDIQDVVIARMLLAIHSELDSTDADDSKSRGVIIAEAIDLLADYRSYSTSQLLRLLVYHGIDRLGLQLFSLSNKLQRKIGESLLRRICDLHENHTDDMLNLIKIVAHVLEEWGSVDIVEKIADLFPQLIRDCSRAVSPYHNTEDFAPAIFLLMKNTRKRYPLVLRHVLVRLDLGPGGVTGAGDEGSLFVQAVRKQAEMLYEEYRRSLIQSNSDNSLPERTKSHDFGNEYSTRDESPEYRLHQNKKREASDHEMKFQLDEAI